jgi:hypothetical protein
LTKKITLLQEAKKSSSKTIKAKNKEIQTLKAQIESLQKEREKETPLNRSLETKSKDKEALAKAEKEIQRIKNELKMYKDNDKKLKTQISEFEQEKQDNLMEIKEHKRKINAYETKIELLKRKESDLEKQLEQNKNASANQSKQNIVVDAYVPINQSNSQLKKDKSEEKLPEMQPIVSEDRGDDNYEFDIESEDNQEKEDVKIEKVKKPAPVGASKHQEIKVVKQSSPKDDYSDDYGSDDGNIIKEPEPKSEAETHSYHKPKDTQIRSESINDKSEDRPFYSEEVVEEESKDTGYKVELDEQDSGRDEDRHLSGLHKDKFKFDNNDDESDSHNEKMNVKEDLSKSYDKKHAEKQEIHPYKQEEHK